jgi:hypothetical protein
MFGMELALIRYLFEREMCRRRAADEKAAAERLRDLSGVRVRPEGQAAEVVQPTRLKRGSLGK